MFRTAPRYLLRQTNPTLHSFPIRRSLSTAPPAKKSRGWKSTGARWGLAMGIVYYYNTSDLFAEQVKQSTFPIANPDVPPEETTLPTLDSVTPARRKEPIYPASSGETPQTTSPPESSFVETEEEASQQGAFNPETGEINWDCPCLGGMAHGPCGEHFRAAFSCFVFSEEDPKGMDCIEHFKTMQTCFRDHPDIYGGELEDEDEDEKDSTSSPPPLSESDQPSASVSETSSSTSKSLSSTSPADTNSEPPSVTSATSTKPSSSTDPSTESTPTQRAKAAKEQVEREHGEPSSESETMVPKAAHDAT